MHRFFWRWRSSCGLPATGLLYWRRWAIFTHKCIELGVVTWINSSFIPWLSLPCTRKKVKSSSSCGINSEGQSLIRCRFFCYGSHPLLKILYSQMQQLWFLHKLSRVLLFWMMSIVMEEKSNWQTVFHLPILCILFSMKLDAYSIGYIIAYAEQKCTLIIYNS